MIYQNGDNVTIRHDLQKSMNYLNDDMILRAAKQCIIASSHQSSDTVYKIKEDGETWVWRDWMFESEYLNKLYYCYASTLFVKHGFGQFSNIYIDNIQCKALILNPSSEVKHSFNKVAFLKELNVYIHSFSMFAIADALIHYITIYDPTFNYIKEFKITN